MMLMLMSGNNERWIELMGDYNINHYDHLPSL